LIGGKRQSLDVKERTTDVLTRGLSIAAGGVLTHLLPDQTMNLLASQGVGVFPAGQVRYIIAEEHRWLAGRIARSDSLLA
jgi:hypothetical protein